MTPAFAAIEWHTIQGRGHVAVVALDRDRDEAAMKDLMAAPVMVDGQMYTCTAIEKFAHFPPWGKGERVGLLITPLPEAQQKPLTVGQLRSMLAALGPDDDHRILKLKVRDTEEWDEDFYLLPGWGEVENRKAIYGNDSADLLTLEIGYEL
jgi:hypothetical protein